MAWLQVEFSSILKPGPPTVALNPVNDARPVLNRPPGMAKVEVVTIRDKQGRAPPLRLRKPHDSTVYTGHREASGTFVPNLDTRTDNHVQGG